MFWFSYSKVTSCLAVLLLASFMTPVPAAASDHPGSIDDTQLGKAIYSQTCIACHGANGKGTLPGVSNFKSADGPLAKSDAELAKSINEGLATPGAALSMPARGGNPSLSDDEIQSLIAYLRDEFGS